MDAFSLIIVLIALLPSRKCCSVLWETTGLKRSYVSHLAFDFHRSENITVTRGQHVHFRCQFPKNFSAKDSIVQWKRARWNDEHLIIAINGKIPKAVEPFYRTELTNQTGTLELFQVDRDDSTTYICQTFETQTILCQYNLVVLSK